MAIARKLVVGGAVAAVIAGVSASPAMAKPDPLDNVRLAAALTYPGVTTAINHVNAVGDFVDWINAHSRGPRTNYAEFGRIGTVTDMAVLHNKKDGDHTTVALVVDKIEQSFNGSGKVIVLLDDDAHVFFGWPTGIVLRDNGDPNKLVRVDETNIKKGDKIGVIGTQWHGVGIAAVVVVKTL